MNKFKHMKTFMLVVEEGSIAQASRIIGISKAAASKQLIDLENYLKTQLMQRTTRSLKLTDTGKSFYESIKKIFHAVAESEALIAQTHDIPMGTLRIASHRHFGERFIINHLKEFNELYPKLKLDIELADRFPDIEKENFDVLCGIAKEGPDHLVRKGIATVRHVICASPEYLAQFGTPKSPDELKRHRYITHAFRKEDDVLVFQNEKEIYLNFFIRLNDAQSMLKCALAGLGFIKIFDYYIKEHIHQGKLIEILKDYREPAKPLYIFYQQQKHLPNKIRLFIDFVTKKVKSDNSFSTE